MRKFKDRFSGFTFIELLVVLVIIGFIVSATMFGFQNAREGARDDKRRADLKTLQSGLARFFSDCLSYPTEAEFDAAEAAGKLTGIPAKGPGCYVTNVYINEFPADPEDTGTATGVEYSYTLVDEDNFILCAALEDAPDPAHDTTGCGSCGARDCNIKVIN